MKLKPVAGGAILSINRDEWRTLRRLKRESEDVDILSRDTAMHEFMEHFICNSEWDWVRPEEVGDLTDAPMLGRFGETVGGDFKGPGRHVGHWDGQDRYDPIIERYAWMRYQVESLLNALLDERQAFLQGGVLIEEGQHVTAGSSA